MFPDRGQNSTLPIPSQTLAGALGYPPIFCLEFGSTFPGDRGHQESQSSRHDDRTTAEAQPYDHSWRGDKKPFPSDARGPENGSFQVQGSYGRQDWRRAVTHASTIENDRSQPPSDGRAGARRPSEEPLRMEGAVRALRRGDGTLLPSLHGAKRPPPTPLPFPRHRARGLRDSDPQDRQPRE